MQNQVSKRPFYLDLRADRQLSKDAFESRVAHSRGDHEVRLAGRTGDGKCATVTFCVRFRRIEQRNIEELTGFEFKTGWPVEIEGDCPLGDRCSLAQFHGILWQILLLVPAILAQERCDGRPTG